jgi:WD40 repeat protein
LATILLEMGGRSVRMSPTDPAVAFVGGFQGLLMCNTATGARTQLQGYESSAYGLCVSDDGKLLASGGNVKTVKLWDTASGRCLWTSSQQAGSVYSVAMHGDMVFCGVSKSNTVGLRMSDGTTGVSFAAKASSEVFGLVVTRGEGRVQVFVSSDGNA